MENAHSSDLEATWTRVPDGPPLRLLLTWGAHEKEVSASHPLLTVGRGEFNGIVIRYDKVSRRHALIRFCELGFVLTDQSVNGTFVVDPSGTVHVVRGGTHLLEGEGAISFGVDPAVVWQQLVRYATSR